MRVFPDAAVAAVSLLLLSGQAPPPVPTPAGFERIDLTSGGERGGPIAAYVRRPTGNASAAAIPTVIALHGCGGIFTRDGKLSARDIDWSDRFAAAGYAVMLIDSFNPRGFREVCTQRQEDRALRPRDRADDVAAGVAWLATAPWVDRQRLALIGWSHGGSSTLWSIDRRFRLPGAELRTAIAFYPGCRVPAESSGWGPRVPLTILIGDADDWTPPEHCRALVAKHPAVRYVEYPGAVHGFDAPNSKLRTRTDLGLVKSAKVGTDPKARAASIAEVERILKEAFGK